MPGRCCQLRSIDVSDATLQLCRALNAARVMCSVCAVLCGAEEQKPGAYHCGEPLFVPVALAAARQLGASSSHAGLPSCQLQSSPRCTADRGRPTRYRLCETETERTQTTFVIAEWPCRSRMLGVGSVCCGPAAGVCCPGTNITVEEEERLLTYTAAPSPPPLPVPTAALPPEMRVSPETTVSPEGHTVVTASLGTGVFTQGGATIQGPVRPAQSTAAGTIAAEVTVTAQCPRMPQPGEPGYTTICKHDNTSNLQIGGGLLGNMLLQAAAAALQRLSGTGWRAPLFTSVIPSDWISAAALTVCTSGV